jgi:hypothetical protein
LGRTQETHPAHRTGIEKWKTNRAAFAPTTNPGGETERVGLRGMLDLSGLSAWEIHFKSWIRVEKPPTFLRAALFIPKLIRK